MSWAPRCSFVLVLVLFLVLFLVLVLVLVLPESFKNFSLQNLGEILSEREAIAEAMHHRYKIIFIIRTIFQAVIKL